LTVLPSYVEYIEYGKSSAHVSHDSQRLSCKWSWRYSIPVYIAEYGNVFSLST
jgi:hypothetical protein